MFCRECKSIAQNAVTKKEASPQTATPIEKEILFYEALEATPNINGNNALYHLVETWPLFTAELRASCAKILNEIPKKQRDTLWLYQNQKDTSAWEKACQKNADDSIWMIPDGIGETELQKGFVLCLRHGNHIRMAQIIYKGGMKATEAATSYDWLSGLLIAQNNADLQEREKILKLVPMINEYKQPPRDIVQTLAQQASAETTLMWLEKIHRRQQNNFLILSISTNPISQQTTT